MEERKYCTGCKENKGLKCFSKNKANKKDGLQWKCKECCKNIHKAWRGKNSNKRYEYYRRYRKDHKLRIATWGAMQRSKVDSDLDTKYFEAKYNESPLCELTGWPMSYDEGNQGFYTPSIDQKVPSAGYTKENTRLVCYGVNLMLNKYGEEKLLEVADAIRANQKKELPVYEYEPSLV